MLVGTSNKETQDRARVVVDFLEWLDPGEGISATTTPVIALSPTGPWASAIVAPPADTTPLTVFSTVTMDAATKLVFLLDAGTPGLAYLVAFRVSGSASGRIQSLGFEIVVKAQATMLDRV